MTKSKFIKLPCALRNETFAALGLPEQELINANLYIDLEDIARIEDTMSADAEEVDSCLLHLYSQEETLWIPLKAEEVMVIIDNYDKAE